METFRGQNSLQKVIFAEKRLNGDYFALLEPDDADYVIPGNDDAIRAIKLISAALADAVIEGKQGEQNAPAEAVEAEAEAADAE